MKKKFLIVGPKNAITYKEVFPIIKENKIWLGINLVKSFTLPDKSIQTFGNIGWFTNLTHSKRNQKLTLYKKFNSKEFPKYDNYDAIEVSKTAEIPMDYDGVMGVPITFLDKYCPNQFEIVGIMSGAKGGCLVNGNDGRAKFYINDKGVYARILIRHKK